MYFIIDCANTDLKAIAEKYELDYLSSSTTCAEYLVFTKKPRHIKQFDELTILSETLYFIKDKNNSVAFFDMSIYDDKNSIEEYFKENNTKTLTFIEMICDGVIQVNKEKYVENLKDVEFLVAEDLKEEIKRLEGEV